MTLFHAMDTNQNGEIDLREFREVIGAFAPTRALCCELLRVTPSADRSSYGSSAECECAWLI